MQYHFPDQCFEGLDDVYSILEYYMNAKLKVLTVLNMYICIPIIHKRRNHGGTGDMCPPTPPPQLFRMSCDFV